ncbi:hypothetical protein Q4E93_09965 [Flavitalea sp. BT771]|uniref:hypothetical protein n=1 Tax=Flavitalea sp. BT771 TaxID=3063329 RepID=UPI0026E3A3A8|nr:hypothetical protein [Flavitalea sp. BT771]MDO6430913.1 hypothetical protein [Flavitalea sp. BT771]MDV6218947.1 hypothetical protein [Flavitalea sp. BT771]
MQNKKSIYTNWRKSPDEYRTYINGKGHKVTFLSRTEAVINAEHIFGEDDIRRKIVELSQQ